MGIRVCVPRLYAVALSPQSLRDSCFQRAFAALVVKTQASLVLTRLHKPSSSHEEHKSLYSISILKNKLNSRTVGSRPMCLPVTRR